MCTWLGSVWSGTPAEADDAVEATEADCWARSWVNSRLRRLTWTVLDSRIAVWGGRHVPRPPAPSPAASGARPGSADEDGAAVQARCRRLCCRPRRRRCSCPASQGRCGEQGMNPKRLRNAAAGRRCVRMSVWKRSRLKCEALSLQWRGVLQERGASLNLAPSSYQTADARSRWRRRLSM